MTDGIYMDNNATTMVAPEGVEEMLPFFTEQFGNPSSLHQFGDKVGRALKKARKQVQARRCHCTRNHRSRSCRTGDNKGCLRAERLC